MVVFPLRFLTWISLFHIPYRQISFLPLTPILHFMFIPHEEGDSVFFQDTVIIRILINNAILKALFTELATIS